MLPLWAKSSGENGTWHPLILHFLDVAACADAILAREPQSLRQRFAAALGLPWEQARPWLLLLIAGHDFGKATPGFQRKWDGAILPLTNAGLQIHPQAKKNMRHGAATRLLLAELLKEYDWPEELAELCADAVGAHHGQRAGSGGNNDLDGDEPTLGGNAWKNTRRSLFKQLCSVFDPGIAPESLELSGPDFMMLAGLCSFADWIGSNETWFPFGTPQDAEHLCDWWRRRQALATRALDDIGWNLRTPLMTEELNFQDIFRFAPRPLQQAVADAVAGMEGPGVILIEAPMGEGKTEAAFYAHAQLQFRWGCRGFYVALPTKATGNAMFSRTFEFMKQMGGQRPLDLQLLHGASMLNDSFQKIKFSVTDDERQNGGVSAGEWFTHKKRALLSEYGVGTIDQALLPILPVKHNFVRLWGLANRVVMFDEIHAYDTYTGTLLLHLIHWLIALGSPVLLLSATVPPQFRRDLAECAGVQEPREDAPYPRVSVYETGRVRQVHFAADPTRRRTIRLQGIAPDMGSVTVAVKNALSDDGLGMALLNTVQRAQELYAALGEGETLARDGERVGKRLPDGTELYLFHARFPADRRQRREDAALEIFGKNGARNGKKLLIATQVAEQSLDLDFDWMVTDLAPADLLLQRAGRLWRHEGRVRPSQQPLLCVAGLGVGAEGETPPDFGSPLWWGAVYDEAVLLRTWALFNGKTELTLPDEIDAVVSAVYEGQVEMPQALSDRLEKAENESYGERLGHKTMAHQAIIGFPDDASWNDPARFLKADDDEPGLHATLRALTRLGDESATVIPIFPEDRFDSAREPDFDEARRWVQRAMNVSRKGIVMRLRSAGVAKGWEKSALLRNAYALELDGNGCWRDDPSVRLDDELGLVFEAKEKS